MNKVRAWVMQEPGRMQIQEFDRPKLKEGEAFIKVEAAGVCGTDKHMFRGTSRTSGFPVVPGHEVVGTVVEMDPSAPRRLTVVDGELKLGSRVVVLPSSRSCGRCYFCTHMPQRPNLCTNRRVYGLSPISGDHLLSGGFAEYMHIHADSWLFPVPEAMSLERAVLCEPTATALRAVERALEPGEPFSGRGLGVGSRVMVIGAGPIGLLAVACLRYMGAGLILVSDMLASRLGMARRLGADVVLDANTDARDRRAEILSLTDGVGPDVVIEAAGAPAAFEEAVEVVRRGGTVIEVGHYVDTGGASIRPYSICHKDVDIHGSWAYPPIMFRYALSFLQGTALPVDSIVTHWVSLEQASEAVETLGQDGVGKVVLRP